MERPLRGSLFLLEIYRNFAQRRGDVLAAKLRSAELPTSQKIGAIFLAPAFSVFPFNFDPIEA